MPNAHKLPLAGYQALNFRRVRDPLTGGTFTFHSKDHVLSEVTTLGAESRVLPAAGGFRVGVKFRVVFVKDGGDLTITGADQAPILQNVNDTVEFIVTVDKTTSTEVKTWRLISDSRLGANLAKIVQLNFNDFRRHDDFGLLLPATAAVDDIGIVSNAFGTAPTLRSLTVDEADDDNFARVLWTVPSDYANGTNITVLSVVTEALAAGTTAALDLQARRTSDISTELQGAAETSVLTGATVVQIITGAAILAGEVLDLRFNLNIDNTAGSGVAQYNITSITLVY